MTIGPFGNCKDAKLESLLVLQNYGGLIAIDKRSHLIIACSDNIGSFTNKKPEELIGRAWSELLPPTAVNSMFLQQSEAEAVVSKIIKVTLNGKNLEISNHINGDYCLVEIEPAKPEGQHMDFGQRCAFLQQLSKSNHSEDAAQLLMENIASLINFDRVMLYKFLPGWHGQVIAEKLKPGIEGFIGLRFPEGDLPANARRLFTINLQRLIADVSSPNTNIKVQDASIELDMSHSQLRASHPVHVKYLKNMGVQASFSVSIVCEGKLWGLIACHHLSPKVLSITERQTCEELTRIAALHMENTIRADLERRRYSYRVAISEINGAMNAQRKGFQAINAHIAEIKTLFNADGIWHHLGGNDFFSGNVPDDTSLSTLNNWVARLNRNQVSANNEIPPELANNRALVRFASGIIHIPLNKNDFILIMRQEQIENVLWAGKPQSIDNSEGSFAALSPRSSFQKWSQQLEGQSEPWHELEIESAQRLREELIDYLDRSEIEEMALKDALTGLSNRLQFERNLDDAIRLSIESDSMFAVYMIDLDNFKPVNDTMGHAAGDELLINVGKRLSSLLRDEDTVARLGGDEFAIILNKVLDAQVVELIANRILAEIKRPFDIEGSKVQIGASIGVSLCPMDAASHKELLREADVALYEVKKSGRNGFKRFEKSMLSDQELLENTRMILEQAFEQDQFELQYQPVFDSRNHSLESMEAFCVWNHPNEGKLNAANFIELIERHQLSTTWAEWGLNTLFKHHQQWHRAGYRSTPLCLNLSAKQFLNLDLVGVCQDLSEKYQVDASWLRIDLDESALVISARRTEEKLVQLANLGVLVNIDHFGQGLLSLRQLTQLKLNTLKIKGSMLHAKDSNYQSEAQFAILNSISNVMKIPLVLTQIDSLESIKLAQTRGISRFQGYAISQLLSYQAATDWLQNSKEKLAHLMSDN